MLFIPQTTSIVCTFLIHAVSELKIQKTPGTYLYFMLVALERRHFNLKYHGSLKCAPESFHCERLLEEYEFCGYSTEKILYKFCFMQMTNNAV